jgi:hypothetical protein
MIKTYLLAVSILLSGCATGSKTVLSEEKITSPKVIALNAPRMPWVIEIETRLRQKGFKVLRWASQKNVKEQVNANRTEEYREAATRYILTINGSAPLGNMHRCFAGGYNFDYITAELIDVDTNETLVNITGSGYSENCPPLSGTIFSDIISGVVDSWK